MNRRENLQIAISETFNDNQFLDVFTWEHRISTDIYE